MKIQPKVLKYVVKMSVSSHGKEPTREIQIKEESCIQKKRGTIRGDTIKARFTHVENTIINVLFITIHIH